MSGFGLNRRGEEALVSVILELPVRGRQSRGTLREDMATSGINATLVEDKRALKAVIPRPDPDTGRIRVVADVESRSDTLKTVVTFWSSW